MSEIIVIFDNAMFEHFFDGRHRKHVVATGYVGHVEDKDASSPPGSPSEDDTYIVASGATGDWAGHVNHVTTYRKGTWWFVTPEEGLLAWVKDENTYYLFDGSHWIDVYAVADPPFYEVSYDRMILYDGRPFFKRAASLYSVEQSAHHCIMNGSFEHWTDGSPDFWTEGP